MLTVVDNVARLMKAQGHDSHKKLEKQGKARGVGGFSARTVGNVLTYGDSHNTSPKVKTLQGVADALGVPLWMLFVPNLSTEALADPALAELIQAYLESSPKRREAIAYLAQNQASLSRDPDPPSAPKPQFSKRASGED